MPDSIFEVKLNIFNGLEKFEERGMLGISGLSAELTRQNLPHQAQI
jgi:hypothetical protein